MAARLLRLAYELRHHRFSGWALDRWGASLALGGALFLLLNTVYFPVHTVYFPVQWLLRARPAVAPWHWPILVLQAPLGVPACGVALVGGGLVFLRTWARRRSYVVFRAQPDLPLPAPRKLSPADKVPLHATGCFEVEARPGFFAYLLAYWRTFESREHAVMAIQHPSRFLWLGSVPAEEIGMWYLFLRPDSLVEVTPGRLAFGGDSSPGLRVSYRSEVPVRGGRRKPKTVTEVAYLAFAGDEDRQRVWADLLADRDQ